MPGTWIDTAVPIILVGGTFIFFYIKLKLYRFAGQALEWMKENFKSKKAKAEGNINTYETIEYE